MKLLILFIVLNVVNVVLQTVRSITTIKCGKFVAASVNALAYGLYTIVIVYTMCDINLWLKAAIVAAANFLGVWVVKAIEDKMRKDKLWKVEATVTWDEGKFLDSDLTNAGISHNYVDTGRWFIFNCYAETQKESAEIKSILDKRKAKYFVSESKIL